MAKKKGNKKPKKVKKANNIPTKEEVIKNANHL